MVVVLLTFHWSSLSGLPSGGIVILYNNSADSRADSRALADSELSFDIV